MSATLILEAIAVLLSIPVAVNTGGGAGPVGVVIIVLLAVLLVLACRVVAKPYAIQVILALQVMAIACWFITPTLGVMGIVFLVAWGVILWFRAEFRRRLAAGTLPGPPQPSGS
jgi:heme/copper-type cytochrome/quinol oxidase subunit 2